jgi:XTP/dITP diphosphohydrolase
VSGRLVLLVTSHRVAPGLLSWPAWRLLHDCEVYVGPDVGPHGPYLAAAGIEVARAGPPGAGPRAEAEALLARAEGRTIVRLAGADGEPALAQALGEIVATDAEAGRARPEIEVLSGSYDLPGSRLLDLVAVMDRLRSPGGCPWDARQTHHSLVQYLLEESYETVEAVESGDRTHLREELGDLLLQVMFHSRIAEEHDEEPFSVDDVAAGIVAKLIHRHPHVFADPRTNSAADSVESLEANWDTIKAAEKGRTSAVDGVPLAQPALALASKLMSRVAKAGLAVEIAPLPEGVDGAADVGDVLLGVVALARARGLDAEAELRAAARRYAAAARAIEAGGHDRTGIVLTENPPATR